ncbi:hypothetical protein K420107F6_10890 [Lactonifactor longoviformis]
MRETPREKIPGKRIPEISRKTQGTTEAQKKENKVYGKKQKEKPRIRGCTKLRASLFIVQILQELKNT